MNTVLSGKKSICNFVGRSWKTVEEWIIYHDFPAKKMNGVWESDAELITRWRQQQLTPQNHVKSKS